MKLKEIERERRKDRRLSKNTITAVGEKKVDDEDAQNMKLFGPMESLYDQKFRN
jgi:hypothetical protein